MYLFIYIKIMNGYVNKTQEHASEQPEQDKSPLYVPTQKPGPFAPQALCRHASCMRACVKGVFARRSQSEGDQGIAHGRSEVRSGNGSKFGPRGSGVDRGEWRFRLGVWRGSRCWGSGAGAAELGKVARSNEVTTVKGNVGSFDD